MQTVAHQPRIAHLSDFHMLQARPTRGRSHDLRTRFVSFGRALDSDGRKKKLARGLAAAKRSGARHFVLSGDLTEMGKPEEMETFAEVLHDSGIDPDRFVIVPGNHDLYTSADAWKKALEGPLAAFRAGAAGEPGKVVEREGVTFLPLDVTVHQPVTRSAGELTEDAATALERRLGDPALRDRPVVVVQHHPPFAHRICAWQWIDGLRGWARLMSSLASFPNVHVLHGHLHHVVDRILGRGGSRIFGAPATVEDGLEHARVRLYESRAGALESLGILHG